MSGLGWLKGTPALRQVLRICLHSNTSAEHSAAKSVIRAFCRGNPEGQNMLAATLVPVADQDPGARLARSRAVQLKCVGDLGGGGCRNAVLLSFE